MYPHMADAKKPGLQNAKAGSQESVLEDKNY